MNLYQSIKEGSTYENWVSAIEPAEDLARDLMPKIKEALDKAPNRVEHTWDESVGNVLHRTGYAIDFYANLGEGHDFDTLRINVLVSAADALNPDYTKLDVYLTSDVVEPPTRIKSHFNYNESTLKSELDAFAKKTWDYIRDQNKIQESDKELNESIAPNEAKITKDLTDYVNNIMENKAESIIKAEVTEDHIGVYVSVNNKILYQEVIDLDKVKSFINSEM